MEMLHFIALLITGILPTAARSVCYEAETCQNCVTSGSEGETCAWCTQPDSKGDMCGPIDELMYHCEDDSYVGEWLFYDYSRNPNLHTRTKPVVTLTKNRPLKANKRLIKPQRAAVTIAEGDSIVLPLSIKIPDDMTIQDTLKVRIRRHRRFKFQFSLPGNISDMENEQSKNKRRRKPNVIGLHRLQSGTEVSLMLNITLMDCEGPEMDRLLLIAKSTRRTKLKILVKTACAACDCKWTGNTALCNDKGEYNCGVCDCDSDYYGRRCECDATWGTSHDCINPQLTNAAICSGRGECICGMCACLPRRAYSAERYSGRYCECDDYSCSYHDSQICGGHGRCQCGECMCEPGYSGEACQCPISMETCLTANGTVCNNHGTCECGQCVCDQDSAYKGPTCEECPTCPGSCVRLRNCLSCHGLVDGQTAMPTEECRGVCSNVDLPPLLSDDLARHNECRFLDVDDCLYTFSYSYRDNGNIVVNMKRTRECPSN